MVSILHCNCDICDWFNWLSSKLHSIWIGSTSRGISEYLGLFVHWAVWVKNVVSIITIVVCSVIFTCNTFEHLFHGIKIQYEIIFFVLLSYWNLYFLFCNNDYFISFEFLQISLVLCWTWSIKSLQDSPENIKLCQNSQVSTQAQCLHLWWQCHTIKIRFCQREIWRTIHNRTCWRCQNITQYILDTFGIRTTPCPSNPCFFDCVSPLWLAHWLLCEQFWYIQADNKHCSWKVLFLHSNSMVWLISTLLFPFYIWFIFSFKFLHITECYEFWSVWVLGSFFSFLEYR